ncbi:MAG: alpha/beta hydrolase [Solirubrobacteraceae bacterium]
MGTVNAPMARRFGAAILAAATLALVGASQAWAAPTATGMLPDGGTWIADVPANWNGTLLLYSHGYGTLSPADAPDPATHDALLADGYALAGSSYDPSGSLWALGSAVRDQFQTLAAVKKSVLPRRPSQVLAFGTSMGGLISALEDQQSNGRLDGALTTCGLVAGGIQLNNYQLDGEYAIAKLLAAGQPIKLVHFSSQGDGAATATALNAAAAQAQGTPAGRARLALAMALMNVAAWAPGETMPGVYDYAEQERQQYAMEFTANPVLLFVETGRQQIEQAAGGNGGWDVGVDFAQLMKQSSYRAEIEALYHEAGISLRQDLRTLTRGANIRADANAIRWLQQTSVPTGRLQVPELDLHTISDQLVPVQQENYYARLVRRAGDRSLLRQAFVSRQEHCNFTSGELIAGVKALQQRVDTGRWDSVAGPDQLQESAASLGLPGGAAFVPFWPEPLSGDNGPFNPFADSTRSYWRTR